MISTAPDRTSCPGSNGEWDTAIVRRHQLRNEPQIRDHVALGSVRAQMIADLPGELGLQQTVGRACWRHGARYAVDQLIALPIAGVPIEKLFDGHADRQLD